MPADQTPPRTRSSTVERERVASILRAAAEAGLLTLDEADERMAACYQSQYRDELAPLLVDLPDGGRGLIPPDPEEQARARRSDRESFGSHFGFVAFVGTVLVTIWAVSGAGFFWPMFPLGFLLLSLLFHAKHRKRRQQWKAHLAAGGGPGDFHALSDHPCRRGHHGHRWDHEYASRSW